MSDATRKVSFKASPWQMIAQPLGVLTVFLLVMALPIWAQKKTAGLQSGRPSVALEVPNVSGAQLAQDRTRSLNGNVADLPLAAHPREKKFLANDIGPIPPLFLPPVLYNSGGWNAQSVAVADVNNDGKLDMVMANLCTFYYSCTDDSTVGVLLGNGDGTFQPAVTYDSGGPGAVSVAIADVNGDHKPDLIVAECGILSFCEIGMNATVGILLGNGDGTFQPAVTYDSGSTDARSVAVVDLNGDGKPDLVVAHQCHYCTGGEVGVLLGNGDGTFQAAVTYSSGAYYPYSAAAADVNGDGKPDIVVANGCKDLDCATAAVGVLLGNGDGTFRPAVLYDSGGKISSVAVLADINGDGKPDIVTANGCAIHDNCATGGAVGVLLGNGNGTFQPAMSFDSGGFATPAVAVGDLNGDGKPDVVVANFSNGNLGLLLGNGDGTLQSAMILDLGNGNCEGPNSVAVRDVDGNTRPDVLAAGCTVTNNGSGGAASLLLHVGTKPTATTLGSSLNPSVFGQAVTFTATVSSNSGTPTGTVIFFNGSTAWESVTLANGTASLTLSDLAAGSYSVTAVYQGSRKFKSSASAQLQQIVNKASTACSLASSMNPALVTRLVTYTATVTSQYGGAVHGAVTFHDGAANIATVGVGEAYSTKYKMAGIHSISATYLGDDNNSGSTSATLTETIIAGTKTTLTTSGSPSHVGQPVTFTATVTSKYGSIPDGELVKFYDSSKLLGSVALAGGRAAFTTSTLSVATHTIKAIYVGDPIFKRSMGKVFQVVEP